MFARLLNWNRETTFAGIAAFVLLVAPTSAHAFYWPGWPGSGETPPSPTPRQSIFEVPPPKTPTEPTEPPKQIPEPATLVIAGLGLGVLGLRKAWKRRRSGAAV